MKACGKIINVTLGSLNTATALVPRTENEQAPMVLGQYVVIGRIGNDRMILARVIELQPDFGEAGANYREAIRDSLNEGREIDRHYRTQIGYLVFKFKLLGVCHLKKEGIQFFSDVRYFPPIDQMDVIVPSAQLMTDLMRSAILAMNADEVIEFQIGDLSYGSDPGNTSIYQGANSVPVFFNAKNILRKRTAVFGASGYGKSNNVKCIVGMLARATKNVGQLLIDTNGEYSLDNAQNEGFLDIFHQAGLPKKVVVFSNRAISDAVKKKYEDNIRPLKIDAYAEPSTVFAMVAETVRRQIKNEELPKYILKWVNGAEVDDNKNAWDASSRKGTIRSMYYAALNNEAIRPARENQKCEVGTTIDSEYVRVLLGVPKIDGVENTYEITKEDFDRLKDEFQIIRNQRGQYYTNQIETMIGYGKWFAETKAEDDAELRDYRDLVISKSYRLSNIKKLHIGNTGEAGGGTTLASGVFKALKDGKIVILDLAMESVRVADVLNRHILNHIFTKMMEDFGRPEIRKEFEKRDIVIYIEEAQNYLSERSIGEGSIYERITKEGRKFNIGVVYVTQQPSAISSAITSQTENIFALHLSNEKDAAVLNNIKDKYDELTCRFIKDEAAQGLCYIYSAPFQQFVVSVRLRKFSKELISGVS